MPVKKGPSLDPKAESPKSSGTTTSDKPKTTGITRVKVHFNCGFNNNLYIRGQGANLSWEKGHLLKNVKADEWLWETTTPFTRGEFKILLNDKDYEQGENHIIRNGDNFEFTPHF